MHNTEPCVEVYTDGSCHTQYSVGGWAAILLIGKEKKIITGNALNTTHNRMELTAVIKAIEYIRKAYPAYTEIKIYADSQYVIHLPARKEKLATLDFTTKKGNKIKNVELVKELLELGACMNLQFVKIKAHQKKNGVENYNREADKLSRKIVRQTVREFALLEPGKKK